jgi:hypothetical protein
MSAKPKDQRPKVISFRSNLDGLNIAARRSVLWPCYALNISIPQKKKSGLNVFEETVLKITEIESGNTEKIALLTCMEKELVAFIQNRLNQLGLLSDRYELSEIGKKLLESWRNKDEESVEYIAGTVFIDLFAGKLLPYVHIGNLKHEKILSVGESGEKFQNICFNNGSAGKENYNNALLILHDKQNSPNLPTSGDIIKVLRAFKKKYKRHALLNHGIDHYPPSVPMAEAITVNENPELVYLHCEALIQIGSPDLLVTDGWGVGFSESFANYLTSHNFDWVTKLKQKGVVDKIGNAKDSDDQSSKKLLKYAEISKQIEESKLALQKIKNLEVNSTYYESDYRQEIENGVKNIYAALEWSLRQVVAENPCDEWEYIFSGSNFWDNERLLIGFAKKVGFSVTDRNKSILQVKSGAIRQIENGKVELQPLLALAIAGASSNAHHPIHRLAQNYSGFLIHALRLKRYRDPIEHGSTEKLNIDEKLLEELIATTVPMIISLVPDVAGDLSESDEAVCDSDINQERLKAHIALEQKLGTAFVSNLGGDIKEQLIRSEIMLEHFTAEKAIEIIKCYASVMQHALLDAINNRRLEIKIETIRENAIEKIVQSGFFSNEDQVPEQLTTVAPQKIKSAVHGSSTTLGAQLLAVFLLGSESELNQLQKSDPIFVDFVAKLIRLRGHGNNQRSDFSRDDMESLKKDLFESIKIIKEVF